jgi:hypothetical protein
MERSGDLLSFPRPKQEKQTKEQDMKTLTIYPPFFYIPV